MARIPTPGPEQPRESRALPVFFSLIAVAFLGAIVLVAGADVVLLVLGIDPFSGH